MLIKWVGGRSRPAFWKKDDCPWMLAIRRRSKGKPRKERSSRARRCLPRRREERTGSIRRLHPRHLEGIALIDIPGLDAGPEPVGPLFGGTVGERIGNDKAPGPLLQTVVPDGAGRAERLLHVARFQDIPRLVRVEGPDSGKAVRLELQPDQETVPLHLAHAGAVVPDLLRNPQKVLHVVADFVCDHIRLSEIPLGVETILQFPVEAQVDVDLLVPGTIKGTDGRLGEAAGGLGCVREQDQLRFPVGIPAAPEHVPPGVLRVGEHDGDEVCQPFFLGRPGLATRPGWVDADRRRLLQEERRIDPQVRGDEQQDDRAAPSSPHAAGHLDSPPVLDVIAPASLSPAHAAPPFPILCPPKRRLASRSWGTVNRDDRPYSRFEGTAAYSPINLPASKPPSYAGMITSSAPEFLMAWA